MKTSALKAMAPFFVCLVLCFLFPASGYPQEEDIARYPSRPITCILPWPPGTSGDLGQRLINKEAEKFLGQPIVIVNKPGAAGSIGTAAIATAKPDGYTIGHAPHGPMLTVALLEKVPYHPLKDFKMIMQWGAFNMGVVVKADAPFKAFRDLIEYARQNPKKVTYGTAGLNSPAFILMQQIAKEEKVQFTHIPFKATIEAQMAILGGHLMFAAGEFGHSLMESGEIRLLLLLREEHSVEYPKAPILKDLGYDVAFPTWCCVAAPKDIPDRIAKKLEDAYTRGMKEPGFVNGMKDLHIPIVYRNSRQLTDYLVYNYNLYAKSLKEMGLRE